MNHHNHPYHLPSGQGNTYQNAGQAIVPNLAHTSSFAGYVVPLNANVEPYHMNAFLIPPQLVWNDDRFLLDQIKEAVKTMLDAYKNKFM